MANLDICVRFGRRVQRERMKRNVKQIDLSVAAGLTRATISQIENGRQEVGLRTIEKLAKGLDIRLFPCCAEYNEMGIAALQVAAYKRRMAQHLHADDRTNCLLEIISNQLQLADREAWFAKRPNDPHREHMQRQIDALRTTIINQRVELQIAVQGV